MFSNSKTRKKYVPRLSEARRANAAKQELTELLLDKGESHLPTNAPNASTPADTARKEELERAGVEFEPGSDFRVIIYSRVPVCDVGNPCKIAGGLMAKMTQGTWGIVERPGVYPGWQCLKITYDLRDLDEHDTDRQKISLGLWRCFLEAHKWCLRDETNDWEAHRTIGTKVDGEFIVAAKVEKWSPST